MRRKQALLGVLLLADLFFLHQPVCAFLPRSRTSQVQCIKGGARSQYFQLSKKNDSKFIFRQQWSCTSLLAVDDFFGDNEEQPEEPENNIGDRSSAKKKDTIDMKMLEDLFQLSEEKEQITKTAEEGINEILSLVKKALFDGKRGQLIDINAPIFEPSHRLYDKEAFNDFIGSLASGLRFLGQIRVIGRDDKFINGVRNHVYMKSGVSKNINIYNGNSPPSLLKMIKSIL